MMLKISLSTIAATMMLAGAATAQTGTMPSTGTGSGAGGTSGTATTTTTTTTITPQQETAIKTYVTKEKTRSVNAPSGFTMAVGSSLPQDVELHTFGSDVGLTQYRYTVVNNKTVVVDPSTRKVVKIID